VLVLYALQVLGMRQAAFGLLLAATAVGGIGGSLLTERVARWMGGGVGLALCLVLDGAATLALGLTRGLALAIVLLGLIGAGYAGASVQGNALRQRLVPGHLLGRVSSVHRTVAVGAAPLGASRWRGRGAAWHPRAVPARRRGAAGGRSARRGLLRQRRDASTGPAGGERTSAAR
jgi:hypothetical protein